MMKPIALLTLLVATAACRDTPDRSSSEDSVQSGKTDAGLPATADAAAGDGGDDDDADASADAGAHDGEVARDGGPTRPISGPDKLRMCGITNDDHRGAVGLFIVWDEYDKCRVRCYLDASCAELKAELCEPDGNEAVRGCLATCPLHPASGVVCSDGTKIPQILSCNLVPNCAKGEDEGAQCGQTTCDDGQVLASDRSRCNGVRECRDGSDESRCLFQCGLSKAVICDDGRTVAETYVCDGEDNCDDGKDERGCPPNFACDFGGTSLHPSLVCDGEKDCLDGADERKCP